MEKQTNLFRHITKSKFVRNVFLRSLAIFLAVGIAIAAIVFYSFTSEIESSMIADRLKQLALIEDTISKRMAEITSIAYNIGTDSAFYMEPVASDRYSDYEMSNTLARYLVGNRFIYYLAYYRISEPDKLYISKGVLSFMDFWMTYLHLDEETARENIRGIRQITEPEVVSRSFGPGNTYFSYVCPLPQFSKKPQAFVLMMIPLSEVEPLLRTQFVDENGAIAVYDAKGREIFCMNTLGEEVAHSLSASGGAGSVTERIGGEKYVVQRQVSSANGWTYVSAIRLNDLISGLASKQLVFLVLLLALMFIAVFAMLMSIVAQYRPISTLAASVADQSEKGDGRMIDEGSILPSTFASLQDDSEQKQHFESAYLEAEAANKAKSAFLSNVSHDIRTPMTAIIGMTSLAAAHADEPDYVRTCLDKAQVASRYLLDIINNVLDMSRIESGRIVLGEEVIVLPCFIDALASILGQNIEAKKQRLDVEIGALTHDRVIGDNVRLTQVFINILSNAVKFTPEGGTIGLRLHENEPTEAGYGDYEIACTDTGVGMSEEFVGHVFDTFSRAKEADASRIEGTGLGMAIAKNLVELMGGTIRCESELGRGTTFFVTLHMKLASEEQAAQRAETAAHHAEADAPALNGKRILLVEDNVINREIARSMIGETGAEIAEAVNGKEAVDVFAANPAGYFDVILMDLQMPVMNGFAATAAIRALPRADAATIPIYAMTASTFDEDVRQVREAGMTGHLGKPYTPEALYRVLREALGG